MSLLNGDLLHLGTFSEVHNFRFYQTPHGQITRAQGLTDEVHIDLQLIGREKIPMDWRISISPHAADDLSVQVNQRIKVVTEPGDPYFHDGHYYIVRNGGNRLTIVFLRDDPTISPGDVRPLDKDMVSSILRDIAESTENVWCSQLDVSRSEIQVPELDHSLVREMEAFRFSLQIDDRFDFDNPELVEGIPGVQYDIRFETELLENGPRFHLEVSEAPFSDIETEQARAWAVPTIVAVNSTVRDIFASRVYYLGPLRAAPQEMGQADIVSGRANLGERGQSTAAVLYARKGDTVCVPLPDGRETEITLSDAVNQWLKWFGLVDDVTAQSARRTVDLGVTPPGSDTSVDLGSVGVGVSQVLPVILLCLLSEPADVLILEQPELHLHPALQKRMADFLLTFVCAGRQILVETHSDHLVNQLRTQVASDDTDEIRNLVKLIFAEQKDGITTYRDSEINEYGGLSEDWPDGFLDISARSAQDLVRQSLRKLKARR